MPIIRKFFDRPYDVQNAIRRMKNGDLRNMQQAHCLTCSHTWWAPTIGACPNCHATDINILERKETGAPRA